MSSILGMGIRTLADTIVHVVYPHGNVAPFHTPQEDQPGDIYFAELGSVQALADAAVTNTTYDSDTHTLTFTNSEDDELYTIELEKLGVDLVLDTDTNRINLVDMKGYVLGYIELTSSDDSLVITSTGNTLDLKQSPDTETFTRAEVEGDADARQVKFYNKQGQVVDTISLPDTQGGSSGDPNAFVTAQLVGNDIQFKNSEGVIVSTVTLPGGGSSDPNAYTNAVFNTDTSKLEFYNANNELVNAVDIPVFVGPSKPIGRYPLPDTFGINDAYGYDPHGNYDIATGFSDSDMRNVTVYVSCSHSNIINDTYSDVEDIQYQLSIDRVIAEVMIDWVYVTRDVTPAIMSGSLTLTNLVNGSRSFSLANNDVIHFSLAEVLGTSNDSSQLVFEFQWSGSLGTNSTRVNLPISSESAGSTSLIITPITNNLRYNNLTQVLEYKIDAGPYVFDAQVLVAGNIIKTMYKMSVIPSTTLEQTYSDTRDISTSKIRGTFNIEYPQLSYDITYKPNGLADQVVLLQGVDASAW